MTTIGIIGGGAWGTALAMTASKAENDVIIWAREENVVNEINTMHVNPMLPNAVLPEQIHATTNLADVVTGADVLLLCVSAQYTRDVFNQVVPYLKPETPVVLCAKGIELSSGLLMSEVVREVLPSAILAVLSGPGFATEVAMEKPTAVTIAAEDLALADRLCRLMSASYFRPYSSTDLITPQVSGAIKNVLAIASGIIDGAQLGDNARAAVIARGLSEMACFAEALGGLRETILGLSGVGDLVLTANSRHSRNYSFGYEVGRLGLAEPVLKEMTQTVEGVATASSVMKRAGELGIDMPLCNAVGEIIYAHKPLKDVMVHLLMRPLRSE